MKHHKIPVLHGECHLSSDKNAVFVAILGSCVATCVYDARLKYGAINHLLIGEAADFNQTDQNWREGSGLMERMLNDMYAHGSHREDLVFKVFGGARLYDSTSDPGQHNIRFVGQFLSNEGFAIASSNLGGTLGRRLEFTPVTGAVKMRYIFNSEAGLSQKPASFGKRSAVTGDVDLF